MDACPGWKRGQKRARTEKKTGKTKGGTTDTQVDSKRGMQQDIRIMFQIPNNKGRGGKSLPDQPVDLNARGRVQMGERTSREFKCTI